MLIFTLHKKKKYIFSLILTFILFEKTVMSEGLFEERRRKQFNGEISYFLYPLIYQVPGLGSGKGVGGTITSLLGEGSTLSLLGIRGEIELDSLVFSDIPLFSRHFTISGVYANGKKGGFSFYDRGPDSSQNPEFTLKFGKSIARALELGLNFFEKQIEIYFGYALAFPEIDYGDSDLIDPEIINDGTPQQQEDEFAGFIKNLLKYYNLTRVFVRRQGVNLDLTDDIIDPRNGIRIKFENYGFEGEGLTNYRVEDYSITTYHPNSDLSSVLVANVFYSASKVTNSLDDEKVWDKESCLKEVESRPNISKETICNGIIRGFEDFNKTEANNSFATSLGGPNRLRSYPISRFYDKYSFFAGLEYRIYFQEIPTPFNFILEKGIYEGIQLALFQEIGQVSPTNDSSLYKNFKTSTGLGIRLLFSSVVLRADYATGKEGEEATVFIGYGF